MRMRGGQGKSPQKITAAQLKKNYRNREPWVYYDTRLFSTGIIPPDAAAVNFAQFAVPLQFFGPRTVGNVGANGYAITNLPDTGKTEADFVAEKISIDVWCDEDAASAAGIATAVAFVESIVNYGVLRLDFGPLLKFVAPIIKFPSGGGVWGSVKVRTQAAAANSDSGNANNGFPASGAKGKLGEPLEFKKGTSFSVSLLVDQVPAATATLARVQAIQALTTTFKAGIRVNFEGWRESPFMEGTPA